MSPINAPNCISCGLGGVYHRVTNPKPWRCRTCGSEFSDDDIRRKLDDEARIFEEARSAERRKQQEEARASEEAHKAIRASLDEYKQWLSERIGADLGDAVISINYPHTIATIRQVGSEYSHSLDLFWEHRDLKTYETSILGRKLTRAELYAIDQEFRKWPWDSKDYLKRSSKNFDKVVKRHPVFTKAGETTGNSWVRWILAAVVIIGIIYACS
jgi:hypothetical protein